MNFDSCADDEYTILQFFRPAVSDSLVAGASYHTGDVVPVLFNGGKENNGTLVFSLYLQSVVTNSPYPYGPNITILST